MAYFNPDFWEISTDSSFLERVPSTRALWFETEEDRHRRHAFQEFFQTVKPIVRELVDSRLTARQKEVVSLYFYYGKTQEDIAAMLGLSQSTVSRHLFGTVRNGKRVGGALQKLRRILETKEPKPVRQALGTLRTRLAHVA